MKTWMRIVVVVMAWLSLGAALQADPMATPTTRLNQLAFLAGNWKGTLNGHTSIEESWSAPLGNSMMGMFRLVEGNKPIFYEFMLIEETAKGISLQIRHFSPGLLAWEEKNTPMVFSLTDVRAHSVRFENTAEKELLTYNRLPDQQLVCILTKLEDGKPSQSEFRFRLVAPAEKPLAEKVKPKLLHKKP